MRLQKYLAQSGVASRRASEKLIAEGHVTVNGQKITEMGVQVEETDVVAVDGKVVGLACSNFLITKDGCERVTTTPNGLIIC